MSRLSANGKWTLANTVISLFTAAMLGLTGWMMHSLIELREFAAKGDRVTPVDLDREISRMWVEIEKRYPPRWLTREIERLSKEIEACQEKHKHD